MKAIRLALIGGKALALGAVSAAQASAPVSTPRVDTSSEPIEGQLDPSTYAGNIIVATDQGDVVVAVEAGEALSGG